MGQFDNLGSRRGAEVAEFKHFSSFSAPLGEIQGKKKPVGAGPPAIDAFTLRRVNLRHLKFSSQPTRGKNKCCNNREFFPQMYRGKCTFTWKFASSFWNRSHISIDRIRFQLPTH